MLSIIIDFFHAILMVTWVALLPLLFWHRWKWLTYFACAYSLAFIVVNRLSHWILGECVFTTLARRAGGAPDSGWFAVRFSGWVFGFIPTNRQVVYVEEMLIALVAFGMLLTVLKATDKSGDK
jgi:hypothetical protein